MVRAADSNFENLSGKIGIMIFHMIFDCGLQMRHIMSWKFIPGLFSGAFVESVKFGEA
jgi:hypothetical protein